MTSSSVIVFHFFLFFFFSFPFLFFFSFSLPFHFFLFLLFVSAFCPSFIPKSKNKQKTFMIFLPFHFFLFLLFLSLPFFIFIFLPLHFSSSFFSLPSTPSFFDPFGRQKEPFLLQMSQNEDIRSYRSFLLSCFFLFSFPSFWKAKKEPFFATNGLKPDNT